MKNFAARKRFRQHCFNSVLLRSMALCQIVRIAGSLPQVYPSIPTHELAVPAYHDVDDLGFYGLCRLNWLNLDQLSEWFYVVEYMKARYSCTLKIFLKHAIMLIIWLCSIAHAAYNL